MPKVSVLIPIYNVEKYIERCARSLFEQTLDDIEYVFVNDCTPDRSMELLRKTINEYPTRQHAVKLINHERNQGVATVRNTGLAVATGEYVIYCDSDDWVEPTMYEDMYCTAKAADADVVGTDFYNEYSSYTTIQRQPFPDNNIECVRQMLAEQLHCGTCNKLVRRDIYIRNNIRFPGGINMWEDVLTMIPVCYYSSKIVYLPRAYYHYIHYNSASYTQSMSAGSLRNLVEAVDRLSSFINAHSLFCLKKDFCLKALTVKLILLLNSRGKQQHDWNLLYPETSKYILSHRQMSCYWRLALKMASWKLLFVFNIMACIGNCVKYLENKWGDDSMLLYLSIWLYL